MTFAIALRALRLLPSEPAHALTVSLLKTGLGPKFARDAYPALATRVAGLAFSNPLGLAAGFDKNAKAPAACLDLGFGFVEVGAVTPRPQPGNERPRVFRLADDGAVINRYGFNNDGLEAVAARLRRARARTAARGVVGVNLGANKDSEDRIADYVAGVEGLAGLVDFYTVNVSSPNTPGLRALQDKASLMALLSRAQGVRDDHAAGAPVFLKVAPDLTDADKADIADVARAMGLDGLIVSNTTLARPAGLSSPNRAEKGGLSGAPLFGPSTALLREFRQALGGVVPLIGVGGVASADDAYQKIKAGASLVQLYTALVYQGPALVPRILEGLNEALARDGASAIAEVVGADA